MPVRNYVWDMENDSYLMEMDENHVTTAIYTNEPVHYGKLISQRQDATSSWYHFDALGSTQQLSSGDDTITDSYVYSAWGVKESSSGFTSNPFRWLGESGYYYDTSLNIFTIRVRQYDSYIARWISPDPIIFLKTWYSGKSPRNNYDAYNYCTSNPLNRTDPSGLAPDDPFQCCECENAIFNKGTTHTTKHSKNPKITIKCKTEFYCETKGCGGPVGAGKAFDRKFTKATGTTWEAVVRICISCHAFPPDVVVTHEAVHGEQFCKGRKIERGENYCKTCKELETEAATVHCKSVKNQAADVKKCINCSVALSCGKVCVPNPPKCNCADIGLTTPPPNVDCDPSNL